MRFLADIGEGRKAGLFAVKKPSLRKGNPRTQFLSADGDCKENLARPMQSSPPTNLL